MRSIGAAHVGVEAAQDGRIFECLNYVAWHGDVDISFVIVPVEGKTAVQFSGPVDGQVVVNFDGFDEMRGVGI